MARTWYYQLECGEGNLKRITERGTGRTGVTADDLDEAEKSAVDEIRSLLTSVLGAASATSLHSKWIDDTTYPTITTIIPRAIYDLARLLGSALVLRMSESYHGREQRSDSRRQKRPSAVLWQQAEELWARILARGFMIAGDGTTIDFEEDGDEFGFGIAGNATDFFPNETDDYSHGLPAPRSLESIFEGIS